MVFGRGVLTLTIVPEQIIIRLDDLEEVITYDEWREFVERSRGKWRGANSEEAAKALRAYVDGESDEGDESDPEKERLREEIERLRSENDRLSEENQRLHEQLAGGAPRGAYSEGGDVQTKSTAAESTYLASDSDTEAEKADETDETGVFAWDSYNPDAEDVVIPEDAIKALPEEFTPVDDPGAADASEQVPAINPEHVEENEIPERTGNAKTALVAGILRYKGDTVQMGEVVATTKDVLDIGTTSYARQGVVLGNRDAAPEPPVAAWLAGRHPDGDSGEWVTSVDAFHEILDSMVTEAMTRRERFLEKHIGLAFGAPQFLSSYRNTDQPHIGGDYWEDWQAQKDGLTENEFSSGVVYRIVEDALSEMVGTKQETGSMSASVSEDWPPGDEEAGIEDGELSAEALVRWWDAEKRDVDERFDDAVVEMFAAELEPYVPDERVPWEEVMAEEEHTEDEAEGADADELERVEQAE